MEEAMREAELFEKLSSLCEQRASVFQQTIGSQSAWVVMYRAPGKQWREKSDHSLNEALTLALKDVLGN